MEIYEVFWKEIKIGTLSVDGKKHKYVPITDVISELSNPMDPRLKEERDWGDEIPFFKTRIENAKKFPNLEIKFHTDYYKLKKLK